MKKLIACVLVLMTVLALSSCTVKSQNGDDTDKTASVTTERDGYEDVTAPPESDTDTAESDGKDTEDTSDTASIDTKTEPEASLTANEAVSIARQWLGETDEETGYRYAYSFDEMITDGGSEYFKIRVSWYLEEEDRYSLCGYLLVSADGESVRKYNW